MNSSNVNPKNQKTLGNLFKELREEKLGLSQRKLAKVMKTSATTICRWEGDDTNPMLTLPQIRALLELMEQSGLDPVQDFPSPENLGNNDV